MERTTMKRRDFLKAAGAPEARPLWRECLDRGDLLDRLLALKAYDGHWAKGTRAYLEALKDADAPARYWAIVGLHQAHRGAPPDCVRAAVAALERIRAAGRYHLTAGPARRIMAELGPVFSVPGTAAPRVLRGFCAGARLWCGGGTCTSGYGGRGRHFR